ncbi:penicillin-binding transpeptidase domain-containing protein [Streptomyces sp. DSM 44915]|uniref:Penicillin-binding transpeptidase domain-containing protein n=1 Tax=Streptomyces chisholmiae TaxID=3075540 RepID=A0ABU2JMP9_9ACTN|nr:penicillin-binding transpeptidase domain-containing protein [Streptomyces sp. DSM 44915]MDT0265974.1 penicillin-binding transpeptidase domain-containing protein [Streptomyces sp. DSM 44915]
MTPHARKRRTAYAAGGLALVAALLAVAVLVLRPGGAADGATADERAATAGAERFLDAWAAGELPRAARFTDDPEAALSLLTSVRDNTRPEALDLELAGPPVPAPSDAHRDAFAVPFTATFTLPGLGAWSYPSTVPVHPPADDAGGAGWQVAWEPALVHPELAAGQTLVLTTDRPERAPILAADGQELAGPATVWDLGVRPADLTEPAAAWAAIDALDVGVDTEALADRVAAAEPDGVVSVVTVRDAVFRDHEAELRAVAGLEAVSATRTVAHAARSLVGALDPDTGAGASGLQERYDAQLSGAVGAAVVIADRASGAAVATLDEGPAGAPGSPLLTTIDPEVQRAAEDALAATGREGSIVAIQPSTGHVLAAADAPADGFNRSLQGRLAPGSTFKIVTTAALLEAGATPDEVLGCPRTVTVNGQSFENQDEFELGPDTTLRETFTASCNTAYIDHLDRFAHDTLSTTAQAFGVGAEWTVGAATFDGAVPVTADANQLAASLIGQAEVQASPLVVASMAATVAEGGFRQPVLVPDAVETPHQAPAALQPATVEALRAMMRATVTDGSAAALAGVPGEPHGKTGTAEFENAAGELSTHAWLTGYLGAGDLAFAVALEDGGSGGSDAGPVAADFLNSL